MCGIFGIMRKTSGTSSYVQNDKNAMARILESLGVLSEERGTDSAGIVVLRKKENKPTYGAYNVHKAPEKQPPPSRIAVFKDSVPFSKLLKNEKYKKIMSGVIDTDWAFIGHTRNASEATPENNRNNHPIVYGSVVGVHNGRITNWESLAQEHNIDMVGKCDSEVIFALINTLIDDKGVSLQEAASVAAANLQGNFACVFAHKKAPNKIVMFRRDAPLEIRYRNVGNLAMVASDKKYIYKMYRDLELSGKGTPHYIELASYRLPNNHGVCFDNNHTVMNDWIKTSKPFKLEN